MIKKIKNKLEQRKIKKAKLKEYLHNLPSAYDNIVISWTAPEHIRHKRGKLWKVIIAGLLIAAMVLGVTHQAWTFALAIAVFAIVAYIVNREHPKDVKISISDIGIKVGKRKYPFTRIKSFWLIYEPPYIKTLNVNVDGELAVNIAIQLIDQDPSRVREFLIERIPEKEGHNESLTDIFARLLQI